MIDFLPLPITHDTFSCCETPSLATGETELHIQHYDLL